MVRRYKMATSLNYAVFSVLLGILFCNPCESIKCFSCNSVNNSACLDLNLQKMHAVVPVVDCGKALPSILSNEFFCRKMVQTILHVDHTPEVRVMRGCGWIKHKRACYKADNADHLETVCQCFGDMCNAASALRRVEVTSLVVALTVMYRSWRGNF